ncbi:MAG: hypothetical protein WCK89_13070, partial [bacterium]
MDLLSWSLGVEVKISPGHEKDKGEREERDAEDRLYPFGFCRTPDSGRQSGQADHMRPFEGKTIQHIEQKYRRDGFRELYKWLARSVRDEYGQIAALDALYVRKEGSEALVVLPLLNFLALLREAGYHDGPVQVEEGYGTWVERMFCRPLLKEVYASWLN